MPFDPYIQQALLNWSTGAQSVTRPTARFLRFQSGSPVYSATAGSSDAGCTCSTFSFAAASTCPGNGSATVSNAQILSLSCSAAGQTIFGWAVYYSSQGGSRLAFGTLPNTSTLRTGSNGIFTAGALIISMA